MVLHHSLLLFLFEAAISVITGFSYTLAKSEIQKIFRRLPRNFFGAIYLLVVKSYHTKYYDDWMRCAEDRVAPSLRFYQARFFEVEATSTPSESLSKVRMTGLLRVLVG